MFATVVAGTAALVIAELRRLPGIHVTDVGSDGRSDLILFDVDRGCREHLRSLPIIEDLFVEAGRTTRSDGDIPPGIASRVWRPEGVERALSVWSAETRPLSRAMTYQVIARVLRERPFPPADLRKGLGQVIARDKTRWKLSDPAQVEVWITEWQPGRLVAGLRLRDAFTEQRERRGAERPGALPPTVAAMLVGLAGEPGDVLLDPCCGSGTILGQALAAGWAAVQGIDIDPEAVGLARRNVPLAGVLEGDARSISLPGETVDAIVSNLPFGKQYEAKGDMRIWLTSVLNEMARVTRPGGRIVFLVPSIPNNVMPRELQLSRKEHLRLPGLRTRLWICDRL
jgi:SAM-dependent methyltransferase